MDEITEPHSRKGREAWAQGVSNVLSGIFGGMGSCAVIGQTMIDVKASGARARISTFRAGIFLFLLVVVVPVLGRSVSGGDRSVAVRVWDASTIDVLDAIETKYAALGKTVEIVGMNESSQRMRGRLTGGFE